MRESPKIVALGAGRMGRGIAQVSPMLVMR
jgi:3-hydroxyacyl-CoA dehydrogenase